MGFIIAAAVAAAVIAFCFLCYKKAPPTQAIVVTGFGLSRPKVVCGRGVFVLPIVQRADRLNMRLILPFKFSKRLAEEKLKEEFGKKLFLPADFLSTKTLEKLRGVYVPFWIYDFDSNVDYTAIGTKVRTWTSGDTRYTETSYFDVYRKLHIKYNGIPVDASVEMPDGIMDLMEPYGYDAGG